MKYRVNIYSEKFSLTADSVCVNGPFVVFSIENNVIAMYPSDDVRYIRAIESRGIRCKECGAAIYNCTSCGAPFD